MSGGSPAHTHICVLLAFQTNPPAMCPGLFHFRKERSMRTMSHGKSKVKAETYGRYAMNEIHLFDENAREEDVFCGVDAEADYRRSVKEYLKDRMDSVPVGTVCEGCKSGSIPFAVDIAQDLEDEGLPDEADEYLLLAETLARETYWNLPSC